MQSGSQSRTPRNVILPLAQSLQSLIRAESGGSHSQVGDTGTPASQLPHARAMTPSHNYQFPMPQKEEDSTIFPPKKRDSSAISMPDISFGDLARERIAQ